MTFQVEIGHLLTAAIAFIGAYFALVKVIVRQFEKGLDQRFEGQEEIRKDAAKSWAKRFDDFESDHRELKRDFDEHVRTLPEKYQRREDAIRQEVAIVSRLDGLAKTLGDRLDRMENKIDLRSS